MYMAYMGNGHHFKTSGRRSRSAPADCGRWKAAPGTEHYQDEIRRRYGAKAEDILDLASSEPVNINVFPNFSLLGNHIQCFDRCRSTRPTSPGRHRGGRRDGALGGAVDEINALRMRTMEQFPNFGEVDDLANSRRSSAGSRAWRTTGSTCTAASASGPREDRSDGVITAPATDEAFMREYIKEWKRLMKAQPTSRSRASRDGCDQHPRPSS